MYTYIVTSKRTDGQDSVILGCYSDFISATRFFLNMINDKLELYYSLNIKGYSEAKNDFILFCNNLNIIAYLTNSNHIFEKYSFDLTKLLIYCYESGFISAQQIDHFTASLLKNIEFVWKKFNDETSYKKVTTPSDDDSMLWDTIIPYGSPPTKKKRRAKKTTPLSIPKLKSQQIRLVSPESTPIMIPSIITEHRPITPDKEKILEEKVKQVNDIKQVLQFDFEKKKENFEIERDELAKEYNRLTNEKYKLNQKKEKEEQHKRMFEEGKKTYAIFKRNIMRGDITEEKIPLQFAGKYNIYKKLDEQCLIGLDGEYDNYKKIEEEFKFDQFLKDKQRYTELKQSIKDNKLDPAEIDVNFNGIYMTFDALLSSENACDISDTEQYKLFIDLYGTYLETINMAKFGLNDTHYLQDSNAGPNIRIKHIDTKKEKNILTSNAAKALGVDLDTETVKSILKNSNYNSDDHPKHQPEHSDNIPYKMVEDEASGDFLEEPDSAS
jgi:hypothetical protein